LDSNPLRLIAGSASTTRTSRLKPSSSSQPAGSEATLVLRAAAPPDQATITQLVHAERLNPHGLDWKNFVLASIDDRIVGAVQMRQHADGARELGSLVVAPPHRRQGIAGRLITALLAQHPGTVHVITARANAEHYRRWGFRTLASRHAPRSVRRNRLLGQAASLLALLGGRRPRRLVILRRA
jgi:amino-acid N-acetyltransferase